MAVPGSYTVRVNEADIIGLMQVGGQVGHTATRITTEIKQIAEAIAPVRTGALKRAHIRFVAQTGLYGLHSGVQNTRSYADTTHQGYVGRIYPDGDRLKMRAAPHSNFPKPTYHTSVAGHTGQPWLEDAARTVMLSYGVHI